MSAQLHLSKLCPRPFCTPFALLQAVLVHQLGKGVTQNPFRKNRGRVVRVLFHPSKSFFVATQQNVSMHMHVRQ